MMIKKLRKSCQVNYLDLLSLVTIIVNRLVPFVNGLFQPSAPGQRDKKSYRAGKYVAAEKSKHHDSRLCSDNNYQQDKKHEKTEWLLLYHLRIFERVVFEI